MALLFGVLMTTVATVQLFSGKLSGRGVDMLAEDNLSAFVFMLSLYYLLGGMALAYGIMVAFGKRNRFTALLEGLASRADRLHGR
jgi:hypothetical protein